MPLTKSEKRIYLQISYGKLRQKASETDPEAEKRENSQGTEVWERVYRDVEGQITGIYYKESKEYGNSFDVLIDDGEEKYSVSFKENSRYCQDFLSKLPAINLSEWVKVVPYDFIPEGQEKNKQGISLWQGDVKIENYFVEKKDNKFIYKHGFPESDGNMDEDDFKVYLIKVKKFLREYTNSNIIPKIENTFLEKVADEIEKHNDDSDLPF